MVGNYIGVFIRCIGAEASVAHGGWGRFCCNSSSRYTVV